MKPILFNTSMVQTILAGRKTQTRRVIDRDIVNRFDIDVDGKAIAYIDQATGDSYEPTRAARYQVGDILWIRETWSFITCGECIDSESHSDFNSAGCCIPASEKDYLMGELGCFIYRANYGTTEADSFPPSMLRWRPSIHMPREAARIFLKVIGVRAERVQDITYDDCLREGMWNYGTDVDTLAAFQDLWQTLYAKKGYDWDTNPWVWVIEFEREGVKNG